MRKIILFMHVSLDGFVAGPKGETDWMHHDTEAQAYVQRLHGRTDAALFGRVTYKEMASYWPTVLSNPASSQDDRNHAEWQKTAQKVVVSKTLKHADWENTRIINGNLADEIDKLKGETGKDIWLMGSPTLAQSLIALDLIDEYLLNISPVILGRGKSLFANLNHQINLELVESHAYKSGAVNLVYHAKSAAPHDMRMPHA